MTGPDAIGPELRWSEAQLAGALRALAVAAGLAVHAQGREPPAVADPAVRLVMAAASSGLDLEEARPRHEDVAQLLRAAGPVLIPVPGDSAPSLLAVVSADRRRTRLVRATGGVAVVATRAVLELLTVAGERAEEPAASAAVDAAGILEPPSDRARAVATLVRARLRDRALPPWWLVRGSPGGSFWRQCRAAGVGWRLGGFVAAHAAQYAFFILSWAVLGHAALAGSIDGGVLLLWALLLAGTVPARLLATRLQASVAIGAGRLLRRRLLHGALRLEPEEIRREGAGRLLGRVLEAEAVEDLAVSGGLLGLVATVELMFAVVVLSAGSVLLLAGLLTAWTALTVGAAIRYVRHRRAWAQDRLALTHDLVEKMVGHRTRQVQEPPERWHDGEDEQLSRYAWLGRDMDRRLWALLALAPRGWVVLGLAALAFEVTGDGSPTVIAVGAGGILLGLVALTRLVGGLAQVSDAVVAWAQVAPLFDAAARPAATAHEAEAPLGGEGSSVLLQADDMSYRYPGRDRAALAGCMLQVDDGDRVLLEGPSGSGKSTLAGLLAGLRQPSGGRLLLWGADLPTTGVTAWRRRVVASPQFHDNHLLLGSLAFNLLLGRRWPPSSEDLREASELCVALGLGTLVERMPSGLQQIVGDTGWQLSHGERSLVFLARALLQQPDLVLLDETFGSLDPVTHHRALAVTLDRAHTLVLISQ
jgi:ATP-binding cassette subfamily B protein